MKKCLPLLFLLFVGGCPRQPPAPTGPDFDIPALVGKTQTQVEAQLGASSTTPKSWQRGESKLTAEFSQSGLPTGFLLEGDGTPIKDDKQDAFLKQGNLQTDDPRYQVAFVEAPDKVFHFTGARVELPSTHQIELRLNGPEMLTEFSYDIGGNTSGGSGEERTLTIPPWNSASEKLQASIGQKITMSARIFTKPGQIPPNHKLQLQIVVDGRVLKESTGPGYAQCEVVL